MVDYHISLARHFAYPHMIVDGACNALPPQSHLPASCSPLDCLCPLRQYPPRLPAPAPARPPYRPTHPPPPPHPHVLFCAGAGSDLLIVSRAAFAPWARNADAPLNEYYNNHNSNTISFHRRVLCLAYFFACMHARDVGMRACVGLEVHVGSAWRMQQQHRGCGWAGGWGLESWVRRELGNRGTR